MKSLHLVTDFQRGDKMGGRGSYLQHGGFTIQEYESTGETIDGIKVIQKVNSDTTSLPQMSNTPGTAYILKSNGKYKSLGIYGPDRRLRKAIDITHGHTNRPKSGNNEKFKRGVAHVHHMRGGRGNNVRLMADKEIKKYGKAILEIGGKLRDDKKKK